MLRNDPNTRRARHSAVCRGRLRDLIQNDVTEDNQKDKVERAQTRKKARIEEATAEDEAVVEEGANQSSSSSADPTLSPPGMRNIVETRGGDDEAEVIHN